MRSFRSPSLPCPALPCPALPSAIINRLFELIEASDEEHARPLTMFALWWPACLHCGSLVGRGCRPPSNASERKPALERRRRRAAALRAQFGNYAQACGELFVRIYTARKQMLADDVEHALWFFDVHHLANVSLRTACNS